MPFLFLEGDKKVTHQLLFLFLNVSLIIIKKNLANDNAMLKQEIRDLKSTIDTLKSGEKEITNVDLLRRISQLEKIILGKEQ